MAQLFTNNAATTLASGINATATSLTVASGKGALFPSPDNSVGDYAILTLTQAGSTETSWEEVYLTARSGDVLTIQRAQEGSTAAAWATGAKVELRITAEALNAMAYAAVVAPTLDYVVSQHTAQIQALSPVVRHVTGTSYSIVTADNHRIIILDAAFATVGIADWLPDGAKVTLVNNSGGTATIDLVSSWTLFMAGYAYSVNTVIIPPRGTADLINVGEPTGWPNWVASGPGLTYT